MKHTVAILHVPPLRVSNHNQKSDILINIELFASRECVSHPPGVADAVDWSAGSLSLSPSLSRPKVLRLWGSGWRWGG